MNQKKTRLTSFGLIAFGLVTIFAAIRLWTVQTLDTDDKYNLNPHPVCAPASFEGKTVTNCIHK